jgi:Flp pilus assembly pilin Flp
MVQEGVAVFLRMYVGTTVWWSDLKDRVEEQGGATAVEYALMVALIAIVIVSADAFVGHAVSNKFSTVGSGVNNA